MEKEKEGQKKSKNYSTPILVAVLILLIIGVTVGYLVKGHTRSYRKASIHKPGTQAVAQKGIQNAPVSTPQNRKQLQHKQSAKASEPAIAMSEKMFNQA